MQRRRAFGLLDQHLNNRSPMRVRSGRLTMATADGSLDNRYRLHNTIRIPGQQCKDPRVCGSEDRCLSEFARLLHKDAGNARLVYPRGEQFQEHPG